MAKTRVSTPEFENRYGIAVYTDGPPTPRRLTMNDIMTLDEIRLYEGSHGAEWCGKQCAVELSNLIAAKKVIVPPELLRCDRPLEPVPFADDHPSISRVIRSYVIGLNDGWDDEQRQKLRPYAARILCTATGPEDEETRAWMVTDWLVRVHAPAFLRLAGLEEHARALEGLPRITDATLARSAQPTINAARKDALAAWDARTAARGADWGVAWNAARAADWDTAGAAARVAARAADWDTAGAAARVAARAAAGAVAGAVARAAAGAAAGADLDPVVAELQAQSLVLLDAMIEVGR